ncbi:MAG: hypothetical protein ACYDGR_10140, partial [Candidatus Dormibacteria bacterium]
RARRESAGPGRSRWLPRLELEHDNLRGALEWTLHDAPADALALAGALGWFWEARGWLAEGRSWLKLALAGAPGGNHRHLARAMLAEGRLATRPVDTPPALGAHNGALQIYESQGDARGTARALFSLVNVNINMGEYALATELGERCLGLYREASDVGGTMAILGPLAQVAVITGDLVRGEEMVEEMNQLAEASGSGLGRALAGCILGYIALANHDNGGGEYLFRHALALFTDLNESWGINYGLEGLAAAAADRGDAQRALRLAAAADAKRAELGSPIMSRFWRVEQERWLRHARESLGPVRADRAWRAGCELDLIDAVNEALDRA